MEFISMKGTIKEPSSCYGDSKYKAFILVKSEQKFKIQIHIEIFDPVIG